MKNLLKSIYIRSQWANTRYGSWALFICAFADASFLPLPTSIFFLALAMLNITNAYKNALSATFGTLLGAVAGYSIGHFAWLTADGSLTGLAQFIFNYVPGFSEAVFDKINIQFVKWDFWILFIVSFIPVPYKIFSISSGVFDVNVFMFCFATLISQALKFYLFALLIIKTGPVIKNLFSFKMNPIIAITTICVAVAIVVINTF